MLNVSGYWNRTKDRDRACTIISNRNVFLGDSDTVVGLYASLTPEGFAELNRIKGRQEKPYVVLVSDMDRVKQLAHVPDDPRIQSMLQSSWPGPLTVIFKARDDVPRYMKSATGTIALRIPDNDDIRAFVHDVGGVLSTSANRAGQPVPESLDEVDPHIVRQVDLIMRHETPRTTIIPSTIIDCSTGTCTLVREGAVKVCL